MLEYLKIENFKCFTDIEIPVNNLTLMAGANGNGKSTVIQALLLLRKTIEENFKLFDGYYISNADGKIDSETSLNNGYLLNLGSSSLVTNRLINESEIRIGIKRSSEGFAMKYEAGGSTSDLFIKTKSCTDAFAGLLPILKKEFYYLNAERIGPRVNLPIRHYNFPNTGFQGENVAQMIADTTNYIREIDDLRKHPSSPSRNLDKQLNAWLDSMMDGVKVEAFQSPQTLTSQIRVENFFTKGDPTIAPNIGFGISYVLPILASGLIAEKGSYLIVENPEAHLHPSAQSQIARFLAMVANAGVRVIVETHSDHVINGIQIAVAKAEVSASDVTINFFSQKKDISASQPKIESIQINSIGELSSWPRGFFDQTQIDLAELFKLRKL